MSPHLTVCLERALGDILSLRVFGETVVIINSLNIARDLVEKRAAIYSDRPVVHAYEVYVFSSLVFIMYHL